MDELLHSIQAYERLLKKSYDIVIGKKGTATSIHIEFSKDSFHHLAGLQYLQQNMPELRKDKEEIFDKILKEEKFRKKIENAVEYGEILGRIISVGHLEQLLDSPDTEVYKCNKGRGSSIKDDYIFKSNIGEDTEYFFIRESKSGIYTGCSIFPEERQKSGHSYMKVLHKVKHDLSGTHELYISPNYKPQSANNIICFDNSLSVMQYNNALTIPVQNPLREALRGLAESLKFCVQNIQVQIKEAVSKAFCKPENIDKIQSEVTEETERNPDDAYSVIVDNTGTQGYRDYFTIVPVSKLDFQVPFTYEIEQQSEKKETEQEISAEKTVTKHQVEYDDF